MKPQRWPTRRAKLLLLANRLVDLFASPAIWYFTRLLWVQGKITRAFLCERIAYAERSLDGLSFPETAAPPGKRASVVANLRPGDGLDVGRDAYARWVKGGDA